MATNGLGDYTGKISHFFTHAISNCVGNISPFFNGQICKKKLIRLLLGKWKEVILNFKLFIVLDPIVLF